MSGPVGVRGRAAAVCDEKVMLSNADEPARVRCPRCRAMVLRVVLGGSPVLLDLEELRAPAAGLYVAVDARGRPRSHRAPGRPQKGEALYAPHDARCPP